MRRKNPYQWCVWRQLNGKWTRLAFAPTVTEAERIVREEVCGPGAVITPAIWNAEQFADAMKPQTEPE
jgi:hypothetical protein